MACLNVFIFLLSYKLAGTLGEKGTNKGSGCQLSILQKIVIYLAR